MISRRWPFLFVVCLLLNACNVDYEAMAQQRTQYAEKEQGEIIIVAIEDFVRKDYIKGISLAVDEVNQKKGLLGRPLKLQIEQSEPSFAAAKSTIRRITANPKVSVVMGHTNEDVAIPASAIYEKSQVLFFPPFIAKEDLTSHGFSYTFRMLPDSSQLAEQMSIQTKKLGFKKVAVLYTNTNSHRKLALLFKKAAIQNNIDLVFERSFFSETEDFRPLLADLKKQNFDAIFLSSKASTATQLVKQIREMGIYNPVLGSTDLNTTLFKTSVGVAGNNIITPTPYHLQIKNPINRAFISRYLNEYKQLPSADAAQGYDTVMLFANKVTRAQSTLPALLASTVHFSPPWNGVTGMYDFNKKGNIQGKEYFFQTLNNEKWQILSAATN